MRTVPSGRRRPMREALRTCLISLAVVSASRAAILNSESRRSGQESEVWVRGQCGRYEARQKGAEGHRRAQKGTEGPRGLANRGQATSPLDQWLMRAQHMLPHPGPIQRNPPPGSGRLWWQALWLGCAPGFVSVSPFRPTHAIRC